MTDLKRTDNVGHAAALRNGRLKALKLLGPNGRGGSTQAVATSLLIQTSFGHQRVGNLCEHLADLIYKQWVSPLFDAGP